MLLEAAEAVEQGRLLGAGEPVGPGHLGAVEVGQ
jgi:hypothetical protein